MLRAAYVLKFGDHEAWHFFATTASALKHYSSAVDSWRLAPAYDLNPMPTDVKPRIHALAIDEIDGTASLDTAFQIAPMFGMTEKDTRAIAAEVGSAVSGWRDAAARFGITPNEVERLSSAFDHEDLKAVT